MHVWARAELFEWPPGRLRLLQQPPSLLFLHNGWGGSYRTSFEGALSDSSVQSGPPVSAGLTPLRMVPQTLSSSPYPSHSPLVLWTLLSSVSF